MGFGSFLKKAAKTAVNPASLLPGRAGAIANPTGWAINQGLSRAYGGQGDATARFIAENAPYERPEYNDVLNKNQKINTEFTNQNQLDGQAFDRMKEEGMREAGTDSAWRGIMQEKLGREAGDVAQNQAQQQQQQMDNIAMRGGLSAGAAERMGAQNVGQNLQAQQNIFGQGLELDLADEQNRQQQLGQLNQADMSRAGYLSGLDSQNLTRNMQERAQKQLHDLERYKSQMGAWAAQKTADAVPSSGGKK